MKSKNSETPDPHRPWVQLGGDGGRSPLPFFENQKSCPDLGKNAQTVSIFGSNIPFKI